MKPKIDPDILGNPKRTWLCRRASRSKYFIAGVVPTTVSPPRSRSTWLARAECRIRGLFA